MNKCILPVDVIAANKALDAAVRERDAARDAAVEMALIVMKVLGLREIHGKELQEGIEHAQNIIWHWRGDE